MEYWRMELYHHGILGMKWGKRNGPPYPLSPENHSASEKKAGWRKSKLGKRNNSLYDRYLKKKGYSKPPNKTESKNRINARSVSNKVGGEKKGLTDNQKKALIIGGAALAIGGAAIMGYKLRQLNTESQVYMSGVRSIRKMISTSNETIADLVDSNNYLYGSNWVAERDFIQDISRNIDKLPDVSKNPFVSVDSRDTSTNLRKDVANLYKNLSNVDTARTQKILNEIKSETVNVADGSKETMAKTIKTITSTPFDEIDEYTNSLLNSNLEILRKMGF